MTSERQMARTLRPVQFQQSHASKLFQAIHTTHHEHYFHNMTKRLWATWSKKMVFSILLPMRNRLKFYLRIHTLKYREVEMFDRHGKSHKYLSPKKHTLTFLHPNSRNLTYTYLAISILLTWPTAWSLSPWALHVPCVRKLYRQFESTKKDSPLTSQINGWHTGDLTVRFPRTFYFFISRSFWI